MEWDKLFIFMSTFLAGSGIVVGVVIPAIGQALVARKALEAIARQPEASGSISTALLIALAMLESLAIYILVVVLILLFANPLLRYIVK
ncbi:MAG TPA: ATP synthase F0 subunit C [Anaerolineae bacterium]|nr:ATP synthase F0 subunit C [Anaerolineae bacterium]